MHNILHDLEGVQVIIDDIIVYGKGNNEDEAIKDHDRKLIKVLDRL